METRYRHVPVMCDEIISLLAPALGHPGAIMIDATLGLGGHAAAVLDRFPEAYVIGIDRDPEALDAARARLAGAADRFEAHEATFDELPRIADGRRPAAILFDLGLSSLQIDSASRGFAYASDAPLTMRMDAARGLTAADVVNTYSVEELTRLFAKYGDEPHAARIARAIVAAREDSPFETSARLVEVIAHAIPAGRSRAGHPAKRVFQALRMEVNDEAAILARAIPAALDQLAVGGRAAVLAYHSGEDRLVKREFARRQADQAPPGLAVVPPALRARFRLVTRGAAKATAAEIAENPRSQSARLRVIERIEED